MPAGERACTPSHWPSSIPVQLLRLPTIQFPSPRASQPFWIVHDEIEGFHQQAIINAAKFLLHDGQIDAVGAVATGAANGVASIALYLGFSTLDAFLTGGGNGGINTRITNNENNLYNLSSASTLSINTLNNTTTSILGYINGYTAFSSLQTNILNVSGFTTLNNNATLLSSLNVSGFTTLNNNTSIFGTLNVSGFTRLNNTTTLLSSLNVSGLTTLNNNTTLLSSLNVSGFTTLNATNINGQLNVSGLNVLQTLNNFNTNLTTLFDDTINTLQIVNNHTTDLSRVNSLINIVDSSTAIHGGLDIIFDRLAGSRRWKLNCWEA